MGLKTCNIHKTIQLAIKHGSPSNTATFAVDRLKATMQRNRPSYSKSPALVRAQTVNCHPPSTGSQSEDEYRRQFVIPLLFLSLGSPPPRPNPNRSALLDPGARDAQGNPHCTAPCAIPQGLPSGTDRCRSGVSLADFVSFRVLELALDSADLERQSLGRHRVTQLLAPHTTENPIFFHATDVSESGFRKAVDQMAEVGFEMLIFSFGSGFALETTNATYIAQINRDALDREGTS